MLGVSAPLIKSHKVINQCKVLTFLTTLFLFQVYVAMFERSKEKYAEEMSAYIKKEQ